MSRWGLVLLCSALLSCRDHSAAPIRIVLGPTAQEATLIPRSSLAEYIEVSATETLLLLSFSSAERACDSGPDTSKDTIGLAIRISLGPGEKLAPGSFPLLTPSGEGPKPSHATSTVKLRGQRRELLPGGTVELRALDLNPQGSVEGMLKLEFPGDASRGASRVSGRFVAHICRINRLR